MHAEAVNELLAEEVESEKIQLDKVPNRLINLINLQTDIQRQQNPQDFLRHWLEMLKIIKQRGFTPTELDKILNLQKPMGRSGLNIDPLQEKASSLHSRIHSARIVRGKVYGEQPIIDDLQFLIPVATINGGLFNFVQAGCFVLEEAEPRSKYWYRSEEFRKTADEISLSLYQVDFPFREALREYSQSFHQNVLGPLGFNTNCKQ